MEPAKSPAIVSSPPLKTIILINLCIFGLSAIVMIAVAFFGKEPLSPAQDKLFISFEKLLTFTGGAFIGLLGGKAASPS